MISEMFILRITISFQNHIKTISTFLGKRAHASIYKIMHAIFNCTPQDTQIFNKAYKSLNDLVLLHHIGSFITEFHSFPNETCGHSRALQAFPCLTGSSQAASIPLSTLLQLICQVALLRLTHLSRFAQGTIKPLKMKIISTEIQKSRLEENRGKAGS